MNMFSIGQQMAQKKISFKLASLVVFLWTMLIASSLAVVYMTYKTRAEFNHLEALKREHNKLQVVLSQYVLEESTWASFSRIEKVATERLDMQLPKAEHVIMIAPKGKANEG